MGDKEGFTLIEVLVALFIMSIGFLALSQMQYLSLRQSQLAHSGTTATNLIQAFSDSDLSRMRSIHNLNMALVDDLSSGDIINRDYCDKKLCKNQCPCDPFSVISNDPTGNNTQHICTAIKNENYKFGEIGIPDKPAASCKNVTNDLSNEYFLTRTIDIDTSVPGERTYSIAYSVKNRYQQVNHPLTFGNSLATQFIKISAHVDTTILASGYSNILVIPNIP